ncbi:MAG TPA: hypothetical protein VEL79_05130 [Vicinamibacterales bacterium]|nr:hypothetical protein [Vicinamibacterales bacterium]
MSAHKVCLLAGEHHASENLQLRAEIAMLREMLHAALDQLHTAFATIDRLRTRCLGVVPSACDEQAAA